MSNSSSIIYDSLDLIKPLCVVCDDLSEGQHFNQFSCKACAAFFRRAVLSKNHYQCKIDKTCKILKDIRNLCKFCRYQKCIDKGMLPSLVQGNRDSYGKRSAFIVSPLSKTLKENCKEEMKILPKMLNGYLKFQNLRKESCVLLVGEKVFENWNPKVIVLSCFYFSKYNRNKSNLQINGRLFVIPHSKYSSAKIIMQTVTKLAHDMIMEYFIPFSSFEPGDMKMLFEKFAVLFDNAEKSYNTFKAYGHIKNNENVILADGGYINLDETHKFFANSMDANVEPQQLAKIFLQCFTYIAKVVVPAMTKVGIDDFSIVAIYGLCLFKDDYANITDKTKQTIARIKYEIIRDLHIYYHNKGLDDTEVTIKVCKTLLLIPTLEHVGRLFHENFYLVDLFSMLNVPIAYKK